jgi:hypothetical protein
MKIKDFLALRPEVSELRNLNFFSLSSSLLCHDITQFIPRWSRDNRGSIPTSLRVDNRGIGV